MASETLADAWLRLFSPTINLPGSGSIGGFSYQPYTTWEAPTLYRGDQNVEQLVYRDVASPGKQLGKLTEVVLELADAVAKLDSDIATSENVRELKCLSERVEAIKLTVNVNAEAVAKEALEKLKAVDPEKLSQLIKQFGGN
jgi:hypothetical protein